LAPLWLLLSPVCIGVGVLRVRLEPKEKKLVKEYMFGLYTQSHTLAYPIDISVNTTYKGKRRVESYIVLATANDQVTTLRRIALSKHIDPFVNETEMILHNN